MSEKRQSSVDWLEEKIRTRLHDVYKHMKISGEFEQAKAMHKEEIETAYQSERYPCSDYDAQEYYNQTFGE